MAKKNNDEKLRKTLKKHEFSEEAVKKLDSTANKNIQTIFDKSKAEDDTCQTEIGIGTTEVSNSSGLDEIIVDITDTGINANALNLEAEILDDDEDEHVDFSDEEIEEDIDAEEDDGDIDIEVTGEISLAGSGLDNADAGLEDLEDDDTGQISVAEENNVEVELDDLDVLDEDPGESESSDGEDLSFDVDEEPDLDFTSGSGQEEAEIIVEDDDDDGITFSAQNEESEGGTVEQNLQTENEALEEEDEEIEFAVIEEDEDEEEGESNLMEALKEAQEIENEFPEESEEENVSLDDIYEDVENDELSPTKVDINQKDILEKLKGETEEDTGGDELAAGGEGPEFESEIIQQDEPSFSAMPEGFSPGDDFDGDADDDEDGYLIDSEEEDVDKEFGFDDEDKTRITTDPLENTMVDASSKLHQLDEGDDSAPNLPESPGVIEEELGETKITSFNAEELVHQDEDEETIVGELPKKPEKKKEAKKAPPRAAREEIPSYNESEMLKHQTTIRVLRDDRKTLLDEIEALKDSNQRLSKENLSLKAELDEVHIEITIIKKRHEEDISDLRHNLNYSEDKKKFLEEKLKKNQEELGTMGDRVRVDLEKLRRKEKDLENQLELVQMDTSNQVQNRENKILELKRKIDALEFNMENTVLKEQKAREDKKKLEDRLRSIMKTLRGSIRLLEEDLDIEEVLKQTKNM